MLEQTLSANKTDVEADVDDDDGADADEEVGFMCFICLLCENARFYMYVCASCRQFPHVAIN